MTVDGFDAFCSSILRRPTWPGDLGPTELAREFVGHFGLTGFPRYQHLVGLLRGAGVQHVVHATLPKGIRGAHYGLRGEPYTIRLKEDDWEGAWEHTLLHEAYEILQEKFKDLCPSYLPPKEPLLCRLADRFAAAALMQPEVFGPFAQSTGLDVVALQKMYRRSYASIALRLTEVLPAQPMLVAIYDRRESGDPAGWVEPAGPDSFQVSLATRTPRLRVSRRGVPPRPFRYPGPLVPRKGDQPIPGSAAFRVIESGCAVHVERALGYDLWGLLDLTVLARPVHWRGHLA
ncbi:MAG: hypothetical protein IH860_09330, partial [Chloroflexi bacterium]|nr:hypothetical protein [Chloroflexota bacterium]